MNYWGINFSIYLTVILTLGYGTAYGQSDCQNLDFEMGNFTGWQGKTGSCCPLSTNTNGIVSGRHTITFGNSTDQYTCNSVTEVAPGSNFSARLGNSQSGGQAESISYAFTVTNQSNLFIYKYAVVLQDPGHPESDQPRFEVGILSNGQMIDPICGYYKVVSGPGIPGFNSCNDVRYKDWTTVGLDLSAYVGNTVTIEFTTSDCGYGGHFGYAYIDGACSSLQINVDYCEGSDTVNLTAPEGFQYLWTGGQTTQSVQIINPVQGSNYGVTLTSVTGCTVNLNTTLSPTTISASFSSSIGCPGLPTSFTDNSTATNGTVNSWDWDFENDGTWDNANQNPNHSYSQPGNYQVKMIAYSENGCPDTILQSITVPQIPNISFNAPTVCAGQPTSFVNTSSIASGSINTWNWNFDDPASGAQNSSSLANPTHTFSSNGNFNVQLTGTSDGGCIDDTIIVIKVSQAPAAAFIVDPACIGWPSSFQNQSTALHTIQISNWDFGDGSGFSFGSNPTYTFPQVNTYNTMLVITDSLGCKDTAIQQSVVLPQPVTNAWPDTAVCKGTTIQLNASGGTAYTWSANPATSITGGNTSTPIVTPSATTNFSVEVTASNGCKDTATVLVTALGLPNAGSTNDTAICIGDTIQLHANASTSYAWSPANTLSCGNCQNPRAFPSTTTTYTLIVTNSIGCTDTTTTQVIVNPLPIANAGNDTTVCAGECLILGGNNPGPPGASFSWTSTNNITNPLAGNPSVCADNTSWYRLTVTDTNTCNAQDSVEVTVNPLPVPDFTHVNVCLGNSMPFTDQSSPDVQTRQWDFGDLGGNSGATNPNWLYASDGAYLVTLSTNNGNCNASVAKNVIVFPAVTVTSNVEDDTLCITNNQFKFHSSVSGPVTQWQWNFGDGNTDVSTDPTHYYTTADSFRVVLTVYSDSGCTDSNILKVVTRPQITSAYSYANHCFGDSALLTSLTTGLPNSLTWCIADTGNSIDTFYGPSVKKSFPLPGVYPVTLKASDGICSDTLRNTIRVLDIPKAGIAMDTMICEGNHAQFSSVSDSADNGPLTQWSWTFGDTSSLTNGNHHPDSAVTAVDNHGGLTSGTYRQPDHRFDQSGIYQVTLAVSDSSCSGAQTRQLTVIPAPTGGFTYTGACPNQQTYFTDITTGNAVNWFWDFGIGTSQQDTSSQQHPTFNYAAPGNYPVTLITCNAFGCCDTITDTVHIYQAPLADFAIDSPACPNQPLAITNLSTTSQPAMYDWQWAYQQGNTSKSWNLTVNYPAGTNDTITLWVENGQGCRDTTQQVVQFRQLEARFGVSDTAVCLGELITVSDSSLGNPTNWQYAWGNNSVYAGKADTNYLYPNDGSYLMYLAVMDSAGCRDTARQNIWVAPTITAAIQLNNGCRNALLNFADQSSGMPSLWQWNFGDTQSDTVQHPQHAYNLAGTYTVQLWASNTECEDTAIQQIRIYDRPTAKMLVDSACADSLICFWQNSDSTDGRPLTQFNWTFGDGTGSNLEQPCHSYGSPGSYTVTLIASDSLCSDTSDNTLSIYPNPNAAFSYIPGCPLTPIIFINNSTGSSLAYFWDFGDNSSSTDVNPMHVYQAPGDYTVTLKACSSTLCCDVEQDTIHIWPSPDAQFTHNSPVCLFDTAHFTDLTNPATGNWAWDFGDNNTSSLQNPDHTYAASGEYEVTFVTWNQLGCKDTIRDTFRVLPTLVAGFQMPDSVCISVPVSFIDQTNTTLTPVGQHLWAFGDGDSSNLPNPMHTFADSGQYKISLIVTSPEGCIDSIADTLVVMPTVKASLHFENPCTPSCTQFSDSSSGQVSTWLWDFGDGSQSNVQHPAHCYAQAGLYLVTLTVSNGFCAPNTDSVLVEIINGPKADFGPDSVCYGLPIELKDRSFANGSTIDQWCWNAGNGFVCGSVDSFNFLFADTGMHVVQLAIANDVCSDTLSKIITVVPLPVAAMQYADTCAGDPTPFTDLSQGQITGWYWNFGDGDTSIQQHPYHTYSDGGTYVVSLMVTNGVCWDTLNLSSVQVWPKPDAQFTTDAPVCENDPLKIWFGGKDSVASIDHWVWWMGDNTTYNDLDSFTHTYNSAGNYTITLLLYNNLSCRDTGKTTVEVHPPLAANWEATPNPACVNGAVTFSDSSAGHPTIWQWWIDTIPASVEQSFEWEFDSTGMHNIQMMVTDPVCGSDTAFGWLNVRELPDNDIGSDTGVCTGQPVLIEPKVAGRHHLWQDGSTGPNFATTSPAAGVIDTLWLALSDSFCMRIDSLFLTGSCSTRLYIPNALTPNDDGVNDIYYIYGENVQTLHFEVFDKWGELVFVSDDISTGWDGTFNGRKLPAGIFVVTGTAYFLDGTAAPIKEYIRLIR